MTVRALKYDCIPDPENSPNVHHNECSMIPAAATVLVVGCHTGVFGSALRAKKLTTVVGPDTNPESLAVARTRLTAADQIDVQDPPWEAALRQLGHSSFGLIRFDDPLEHLRGPLPILRSAKKLLTLGGRIVVRIPNVAHRRIRRGLLGGKFTYTDSGILDRTHLRFFTMATGRALTQDAGYTIVESDVAGYRVPHWLMRRLSELLAIQLVFAATPA